MEALPSESGRSIVGLIAADRVAIHGLAGRRIEVEARRNPASPVPTRPGLDSNQSHAKTTDAAPTQYFTSLDSAHGVSEIFA